MTPKNANNAYLQNSIYTASPEKLTLMLYDGIIRFVNQAIQAVEEKNIPKAHESILRAEDILTELQSTLDFKYEISEPLFNLYDYMKRRLVEANAKKSAEPLLEVLDMGKEFRETWAEAMKLAKNQGYQAKVASK